MGSAREARRDARPGWPGRAIDLAVRLGDRLEFRCVEQGFEGGAGFVRIDTDVPHRFARRATDAVLAHQGAGSTVEESLTRCCVGIQMANADAMADFEGLHVHACARFGIGGCAGLAQPFLSLGGHSSLLVNRRLDGV